MAFFFTKNAGNKSITKQFNSKLASSVCCAIIVFFTFLEGAKSGCASFLTYIVLDLFIRDDNLSTDAIIHHVVSIALVIQGLVLMKQNPQDILIDEMIRSLLLMEITTPFLHIGWILQKSGDIHTSTLLYLCLLILWIPYRLIFPITAFLNYVFSSYTGLLILASQACISVLITLQYLWFCRLCVLGLGMVNQNYIKRK